MYIVNGKSDTGPNPGHLASSTAFVVGPYVKQGAVINTRYSQVNALRTIEDILGTEHINLNTAFQSPMEDVFDVTSSGEWTYTAEASSYLPPAVLAFAEKGRGVKFAVGPMLQPRHNAAYWEKATKGYDFSVADQVPARFNRVLWTGLMGDSPYPTLDRRFFVR